MSVQFTNNLPRYTRSINSRAGRVVRKTIAEIEARIKVSFSEPKHGNVDSRGHQASAPGEAPAIDYGVLANSVQAYMETDTRGGIGVGAEYGPHLELGTSNMEPRPFMLPAAESVKRNFQESLRHLT
jgi:hypothetical protein